MNGWIVLVGHGGYPARVSIEDMEVAGFDSREAAWAWIEKNRFKGNAYPIQVKAPR